MGISKLRINFPKMKLSVLLVATSAALPRESRETRNEPRELDLNQEKRYKQLVAMMEHYNPEFDERKYWQYGCNCLNTNDRPMSDPGYGPPVDALDAVCKEYKDCVKCARLQFGEMCIGEFVKYKYGISNNEVRCKNKANSCDRALCECDAMLARKHVGVKDVFTEDHHYWWAPNGWDPKNDHDSLCPRGGGGDPQCCTNQDKTSPFIIYNADNKKCCEDGRAVGLGDFC